MIAVRQFSISIMVLFAVALHLNWAIVILFDDAALSATGVTAIQKHIDGSPALLSALIAGAATLALIGIATKHWMIALFLLPQQVLLMMSMAGGIEAIWVGQLADGHVMPRASLLINQSYSIMAAIFHTIAIISHAVRSAR